MVLHIRTDGIAIPGIMLARGCKQTKMAGPVADLDSTQAWSFTNVNGEFMIRVYYPYETRVHVSGAAVTRNSMNT